MSAVLWRTVWRLALRAEWALDALQLRGDDLMLHVYRLQLHATDREREARQ